MQIHQILENLSEPDLNGGCRLWLGGLTKDGYGHLKINHHRIYAHRLAYEVAHGPIPQGLGVLHKCHTRCCINADHLYAGTNRENVDDRLVRMGCDPMIVSRRQERDIISLTGKRGYRKSGKVRKSCRTDGRHGINRVLTIDQVREIRSSTEKGSDLAARYGVTPSTICKIRKGQLWAALPD